MQKKISELISLETIGIDDVVVVNEKQTSESGDVFETKKATIATLKNSLEIPRVNNEAENRLITHTNNQNVLNAESNATFDGNTLNVNGEIRAGNISINSNIINSTGENDSLILKPNGTGAIQKDEQGQTRGDYAIDLQSQRGDSSHVAKTHGSVIGGGSHNSIGSTEPILNPDRSGLLDLGETGVYGTISGGNENIILRNYCTIPGGSGAKTINFGEFAHASGNFNSPGDAQHSIFVARGVTPKESLSGVMLNSINLSLDGAFEKPVMPDNSVWTFEIKLSAISISENNNDSDELSFSGTTLGAWWIFRGGALVDSVDPQISGFDKRIRLLPPLITESGSDSELNGISANVSAYMGSPYDYPNSLEIKVSGIEGKTINWVAVIDVCQVSQNSV